jgi:hypothetical protein
MARLSNSGFVTPRRCGGSLHVPSAMPPHPGMRIPVKEWRPVPPADPSRSAIKPRRKPRWRSPVPGWPDAGRNRPACGRWDTSGFHGPRRLLPGLTAEAQPVIGSPGSATRGGPDGRSAARGHPSQMPAPGRVTPPPGERRRVRIYRLPHSPTHRAHVDGLQLRRRPSHAL